jgi:hypothetical protein
MDKYSVPGPDNRGKRVTYNLWSYVTLLLQLLKCLWTVKICFVWFQLPEKVSVIVE